MTSKSTRSDKRKRNFVPWKAERRAATKTKQWLEPDSDGRDAYVRHEKPSRLRASRP